VGRSSSFLDIIIGAKDDTRKGVQGARREMASLASTVTAVSAGFLAARAAIRDVGSAIDSLIGSTIRSAGEFQKFEQRLGISASVLSELKFAAELNNIEFNQLSIGMQRATRRIAEASVGTGEAQAAIKELGFEARALNRLPLDQQFEEIAEALFQVESQSDKVRLAFKLFDSEGVGLLQTMTEGKAGLQAYRKEARDLGIAMDDELIKKADDARKAQIRLKAAIVGIANAINTELLGAIKSEDITQLTDMFREMAVFAGQTTTITIEAVGFTKDVLEFLGGGELDRRRQAEADERARQQLAPEGGPFIGRDLFRFRRPPVQEEFDFDKFGETIPKTSTAQRDEARAAAELKGFVADNLRIAEAAGKVQFDKLESIREESEFIQAITEEQRAGVGHVENVRDAYNALGDQLRLTEQLTAEIGGTMVDLAFEFADQMGSSMTAIFRSIVNSAIAELARLAARRAAGSFLGSLLKGAANVLLPGSGVVLDQIDETLAGTAPLGPTLGLAGGRPAVFNIQINAGFGTRGEGVAAARAIVSYAREAGL